MTAEPGGRVYQYPGEVGELTAEPGGRVYQYPGGVGELTAEPAPTINYELFRVPIGLANYN
ncbi:hypothetical protein B9S53_25850 [Arthrospira sp. O9.13F]|nr:hypothetical protein B9S53_25850 [Arthrospira sp. O9.13F]